MSKRIKSKKYVGVYYRDLANNDRVFEFTYKDINGIKKWVKVGLASHNINEAYKIILLLIFYCYMQFFECRLLFTSSPTFHHSIANY